MSVKLIMTIFNVSKGPREDVVKEAANRIHQNPAYIAAVLQHFNSRVPPLEQIGEYSAPHGTYTADTYISR